MLRLVQSHIEIASRPLPDAIVLPHVSLVVINHNYARYIGDTIRSILGQSYPFAECLIVDNGSTDASIEVIRDHIGDDPRFTLVEFDRNYGHLGAALKILDRLKGEFVCFVDADDILFPHFVASHIQTHLAAPETVSLTSSNVIEIDADGRVLSGALPWLRGGGRKGFRRQNGLLELPMLSAEDRGQLAEACSTFDSNERHWLWAPGTSNMYRRSMIAFLLPNTIEDGRRGGVDCFLNYFGHALTGSCVIDLPLSAYRIHGANDHSRRPSLNGLYPGLPHNVEVDHEIARTIGTMVLARVETIGFAVGASRFWQVVDVIGARSFRAPADYHRSLLPAYAAHYSLLVKQHGERVVADELRRRIGFRDFSALWREAHRDHSAVAAVWTTVAAELRHRRAAVRRALGTRVRRLIGMIGGARRLMGAPARVS